MLVAFTLGWYFSKLKFTRLNAKYNNAELELDKLKSKLEFLEKGSAEPTDSELLK